MKEQELAELLHKAYPEQAISDDRLSAVARKVRLGSARARRRRLALGAGGIVLLGAAVGFAYPVAQANWFGMNVARKMAAAEPYRLTLTVLVPPVAPPGVQFNTYPSDVYVAGHDAYEVDRYPWATTFRHFDASHIWHRVHPVSGVDVVERMNADPTEFFELPLIVMQKLGEFDLHKGFKDLGLEVVDGKKVEKIEMPIDSPVFGIPGDSRVLLDMDREKGVPLSVTILLSKPNSFPGFRFDYHYDPVKVQKTVDMLRRRESASKPLDLDRERPEIRTRLSEKPLSATPTGRDILKIHEVEENANGDVFVLYSCRGYHSVEDNIGDWIQLRDDSGEKWLSSIVDLQFSKLAPKGLGLKAQVFFAPRAPKTTSTARLSIRLDDWEYLRTNDPSTRTTHDLPLGTFRPVRVTGAPDWFFYSFADTDESWLTEIAQPLRIKYALKSRDFTAAVRLGRAVESHYPDMMTGYWYPRSDLDSDLAKAYKGAGAPATAKRYTEAANRSPQP